MSHEFRTPLNSVLALSRLLLDRIDGELTPEQERQVGYIRRSAESLLELVNDLLDLAKVEAGKVDVKPVAFTVAETVRRPARRAEAAADQHGGRVDFRHSRQGCPTLFTDEAKVTQILRNLISNALKFTEQGEVRVTASLRRRRRNASIFACATPVSASRRERSRAGSSRSFPRSTPESRSASRAPVSACRCRVRSHELLGGELTVESVLGQGSVFTLSIPARTRRSGSRAQRSADDAQQAGSADRRRRDVPLRDAPDHRQRAALRIHRGGRRRRRPEGRARAKARRHHPRPADADRWTDSPCCRNSAPTAAPASTPVIVSTSMNDQCRAEGAPARPARADFQEHDLPRKRLAVPARRSLGRTMSAGRKNRHPERRRPGSAALRQDARSAEAGGLPSSKRGPARKRFV